ncbi:MAG: acetyl-CoA C-acetyltransferase [Chloroflexi bacterium]|nr:acetyl-CoA C-acetyltransferase [Dehalococcoidia bacterium]MCO5202596.1 acetyl-CoA C-acetyltransferase [Chloroflexota bacterium]PWB47008.1 MAG: acetyl-CoA acetyltransferase [Dehalococcoidia bacterium]
MSEAWIIDGVRSPRGGGKPGVGSLTHIHPQRVLAQVLNALKDHAGFDPAGVEDVIMGNNSGVGDHSMDIARMATLDAGWPVTVPGVTLHRFCGSGQQAVNMAAMSIMSGQNDLLVAGGVESMSRPAPMSVDGFTANNAHLYAQYPLIPQGISADLIATLEGFSREECDRLAAESQRRAAEAIDAGRFKRSVVPIHNDDGTLALDHDEHPRPGTTVESLAGLNPSFAKMGIMVPPNDTRTYDEICKAVYPQVNEVNHVHHAGNSSGVVDGASALLLASPEYAKAHGLKPRARLVQTATAGSEPVIMLTAPAPASQIALKKAGMRKEDIDLFEVNEAFASVVLKYQREMGLDGERMNVNGGAIALGHPIGATGGMLIQTALDELERRNKSTALITMCTGGGMGTATIIERI